MSRDAGRRPSPQRAGLVVLALLVLAPGFRQAASVAAEPTVPAAQARLFKDDLEREVRVPVPPRRIVSLLPSLTETICALGACERLIATDRFSNWPARVSSLPKIGDFEHLELESLVRLAPDLVLLSRTQRIDGRLAQLGLAGFALDSETYASIAHDVAAIGALLGEPQRASALNERIEREVQRIGAAARGAQHGRAPSVYFEVDPTPYAAGASSYIGELLGRLGARNIVDRALGPFPKLNPEYVVRRDPDIIMMSSDQPDALEQRPGWAELRSVRAGHICRFDKAVRDTIVRPGPRVAEGMAALAACLARWPA